MGILMPFLVIDVLFIVWRARIIQFPTYEPVLLERLLAEPLSSLGQLITTILSDLYQVGILAWAKAFHISDLLNAGARGLIFGIASILLTAILILLFWLFIHRNEFEDRQDSVDRKYPKIALQLVLAGSIALFGAGWPFWLTNLPIALEFPRDRFTLSMILGVSLLVAGILSLLFRNAKLRVSVLAVLIGLGAGRQVYYGNEYRLA